MLLVTFTKKSLSIQIDYSLDKLVYFLRKNLLVKRTYFSLLRQLCKAAFGIKLQRHPGILRNYFSIVELTGFEPIDLPDVHRDALS